MTPLITILLMHVGPDAYAAEYSSRHECGEALLAFSSIAEDLEREYGGEAWASCVRTWAPSVSIRPKARPVDT